MARWDHKISRRVRKEQPFLAGISHDTAVSMATDMQTDLLPAADDTYNLGSAALVWKTGYINTVESDQVNAAAATITTGGITTANITTGNITTGNITTGNITTADIGSVDSDLDPTTSDTYDLGNETRLWRKAWISEIDALIFAENTILRSGGYLMVTKDAGSLAADVNNSQTTVDFGTAMTAGDFVIFRAAGAVEYMTVGTLVSGTTYNVTRNVDGSGANAWAAGTPFAVLGQSGDGRIELTAYTTPKISVLEQGATYNAATVRARIGDLNGAFGVSAETYGIGIGDYANSNYLLYNPADSSPFKIVAGGGGAEISESGITLNATTIENTQRALTFLGNDSAYPFGGLYGSRNEGTYDGNIVALRSLSSLSTDDVTLTLEAWQTSDNHDASIGLVAFYATDPYILMSVYKDSSTNQSFKVTANSLAIYRGGTTYTGGLFIPLVNPLTSGSYDGDAFSTTGKTLIDLSSVFSAPAGIKAVELRISARDSGSGSSSTPWFGVGPSNSDGVLAMAATPRGLPNDYFAEAAGVCPCDANGDIYYQCAATGTGTLDVILQIWGYWI